MMEEDLGKQRDYAADRKEKLRLRKRFFLAVKNKNVEKVSKFLQNGADPNCVYDDVINGGMTGLHSSVLANSFEMVQCLIENGADVNLADRDGETPIFATIFDCDDRIRRLLIEKGADVNAKDTSGKSPLMKAFETSEMFNYNIRYSVISEFLQCSSDVHQVDKDGRSLLHLVSVVHNRCHLGLKGEHCCRAYLEYLRGVQEASNTAPDSWTPGTLGSQTCQIVSQGTRIHASACDSPPEHDVDSGMAVHYEVYDCIGQTPLHKAASSCCLEAVQFLIEIGYDATLEDNNSKTALHCLGEHPNRPDFSLILEILIKAGCNINAVDYMGRTPLHYVAASNDTCREAVEVMIRYGYIVDHLDKCGHNPLHLCVHPGVVTDHSDVVGDKKDAVHIGDVVKVLVENGIDVNAVDNDRLTALHFAVRRPKRYFI